MIIDNVFTTAKYRMYFIILLTVSLISAAFGFIEPGKYQMIAFVISGISLLGYIFMHLMNLYYFYCSAEKNKLIFRFYHAHPGLRKYKAFEITKSVLSDYQIHKSLFGLRKSLIIKVKSNKGEGSYPPLSISALNTSEIARLEKTLNTIIRENKSGK